MKRTPYSPDFKEQALRKVRQRGSRTQQSVASELNISLAGQPASHCLGCLRALQALSESHSFNVKETHLQTSAVPTPAR